MYVGCVGQSCMSAQVNYLGVVCGVHMIGSTSIFLIFL